MDPMRDADLYRGLEEKLGTTVATSLMERLPPAPPDRLATKDDVDVVARDLASFRTDVGQRFSSFRTEVDLRFDKVDQRFDKMDERFAQADQRFTGIEVAMATLQGEMRMLGEQMGTMQVELLATVRGELITGLHVQSRQMVLALIGSLVGLSGAAWLLSQLAG